MSTFLVLAGAALIPMVMGFVWYNPKTLGKAWMESAGLTEEKLKGANMPLIFGLSYVFSLMLASLLQALVIHQFHLASIVLSEPGFAEGTGEAWEMVQAFKDKYGTNFRTFGHGMLHGLIGGFFIALPILATNAMFERKGFKYIAVNGGYWIITLGLMGGVICAFA